MLITMDFFFRGFIVLGTIIIIFSNLKTIKNYRRENEKRTTIKYYKTIFQQIPTYSSYISSILIGLALFRVGSLLNIGQNMAATINILNVQIMDTSQTMQYQAPIIIMGLIGSVMYIAFSLMLSLSYTSLGKNFSDYIDIKEGNNLVTDKIYSIIRHPMYLSEIMIPLAASIALLSWTVFLWTILVQTPLYIIRARKEDELLENYYGREFLFYKQKVNSFIPTFKK